jgi:hypothetical protein
MIKKKAAGKQQPVSRLSLASRLLGDAVRATLAVPPPEEGLNNMMKGTPKRKRRK